MAMTEAGRRLLERGDTADMFEGLERSDPTAEQGIDLWDGRSPRELTEAAISFSLAQEGASLNEFDAIIDEQCRRHFHGW